MFHSFVSTITSYVALQAEIARLMSRVAELDGANNVLREQLDRSTEREDASVREVQRVLDKTEFELCRAKERLAETEGRLAAEQQRVSALERELSSTQDQIFRRDRQLREERERVEQSSSKLEECRNRYEEELSTLRAQLVQERQSSSELVRKHRAELDSIKEEVSLRLPAIAASAAERVEEQCSLKAQRDIEAVKLQYESNIQRMRREILNLQSELAETEARHKSVTAEERSELERLRAQLKRFQRRSDELEEQLDTTNRRHTSNNSMIRQSSEHNSFAATLGSIQVNGREPSKESPQSQLPGDLLAMLLQGQLTSMQQQLSQSLMGSRSISHSTPYFHPPSVHQQGTSTNGFRSYSMHNANEQSSNRSLNANDEMKSALVGDGIDGYSRRAGNERELTTYGEALIPLSPLATSLNPRASASFLDADDQERLFQSPMSSKIKRSEVDVHSSVNFVVDEEKLSAELTSSYASQLRDENNKSKVSTVPHKGSHLKQNTGGLNRGSVPMVRWTDDFEGVFDGGYHEGYWKAKYLRTDD